MKPHPSTFGLLAPSCTGNARKVWNEYLKEQGIDGFFDFYRTVTVRDLELRLSEMFLLERRGYIIAPEFQTAVMPLLDRIDAIAVQKGSVDTVMNERGVLIGYFLDATSDQYEKKCVELWSFSIDHH